MARISACLLWMLGGGLIRYSAAQLAGKSRRLAQENRRPLVEGACSAQGASPMPPMNNDDDIPQASHAHVIKCACGCGIVSVKLFGNDAEAIAEMVFEPEEWLDFIGRLKLAHLHS
jgi:hypothetical protein